LLKKRKGSDSRANRYRESWSCLKGIPMARTAIVSGASRGIGRSIAKRLAKDGFAVGVNYAGNAAEAKSVLDEIRSAALVLEAFGHTVQQA
jgi:NAD(P)-dependent dehydrogenase (short-subunit alcohol dehydrogenase family)